MDNRIVIIKPALNTHIKKLRENYLTAVQKKNANPNPDRLELISILEIIHDYFRPNKTDEDQNELLAEEDDFCDLLNEEDAICKAAWIFCLECIIASKSKFKYHGSSLEFLILQALDMDNPQDICKQYKLDYLSQLYSFLFPEPPKKSHLADQIQSQLFKLNLRESLLTLMQSMALDEKVKISKIMRSLPKESTIDKRMQNMLGVYKERASELNKDREFLAKLAAAISKNNPPTDSEGFIPDSLRLKLGLLIYIRQLLYSPWYDANSILHNITNYSPWYNAGSTLYKMTNEIMNDCFEDINLETKIDCLIELKKYLEDYNHQQLLQNYMNQNFPENAYLYLNLPIYTILKNLDHMIAQLAPDKSTSTVTWTALALGAFIGGLPGYGIGYEFGRACGMMDQFNHCKNILRGPTQGVLKILVGDNGSYLGYFASDAVVNATLQRFFAKTLEAVCAALGALGLGGTVFILKNYTTQTLNDLCHLYLHLQKKISLPMVNNEDQEYVQMLLRLPNEVFSKEEHKKLREITGIASQISLGFILNSSIDLSQEETEEIHYLHQLH